MEKKSKYDIIVLMAVIALSPHLVQTFSVHAVLFRCFKQRADRIAMICIVQYLELVSPQPALMVGIFQLPKSVCFSAFSFTNELGFYVQGTTNCTNLTILRGKFIGFFFSISGLQNSPSLRILALPLLHSLWTSVWRSVLCAKENWVRCASLTAEPKSVPHNLVRYIIKKVPLGNMH